jgi:hypothetical protein
MPKYPICIHEATINGVTFRKYEDGSVDLSDEDDTRYVGGFPALEWAQLTGEAPMPQESDIIKTIQLPKKDTVIEILRDGSRVITIGGDAGESRTFTQDEWEG